MLLSPKEIYEISDYLMKLVGEKQALKEALKKIDISPGMISDSSYLLTYIGNIIGYISARGKLEDYMLVLQQEGWPVKVSGEVPNSTESKIVSNKDDEILSLTKSLRKVNEANQVLQKQVKTLLTEIDELNAQIDKKPKYVYIDKQQNEVKSTKSPFDQQYFQRLTNSEVERIASELEISQFELNHTLMKLNLSSSSLPYASNGLEHRINVLIYVKDKGLLYDYIRKLAETHIHIAKLLLDEGMNALN